MNSALVQVIQETVIGKSNCFEGYGFARFAIAEFF